MLLPPLAFRGSSHAVTESAKGVTGGITLRLGAAQRMASRTCQ
ncbi:hypothetical protein SAMN05519103_01818 [Rhizobiales bacterium GAS113]|nr:hypothetical protein SAMN05519103_01818 [Rhizobiales bacterium GAS113]